MLQCHYVGQGKGNVCCKHNTWLMRKMQGLLGQDKQAYRVSVAQHDLSKKGSGISKVQTSVWRRCSSTMNFKPKKQNTETLDWFCPECGNWQKNDTRCKTDDVGQNDWLCTECEKWINVELERHEIHNELFNVTMCPDCFEKWKP